MKKVNEELRDAREDPRSIGKEALEGQRDDHR